MGDGVADHASSLAVKHLLIAPLHGVDDLDTAVDGYRRRAEAGLVPATVSHRGRLCDR